MIYKTSWPQVYIIRVVRVAIDATTSNSTTGKIREIRFLRVVRVAIDANDGPLYGGKIREIRVSRYRFLKKSCPWLPRPSAIH